MFSLNKATDGFKIQKIAAEMVPVNIQSMNIEVAEIFIQRMAKDVIETCHTEVATINTNKIY